MTDIFYGVIFLLLREVVKVVVLFISQLHPADLFRISDDPVIVDNEPPSITTNYGKTAPQEHETTSNTNQDSIKVQVNLCGAVTITEVRALLKEWIQTSNGKNKYLNT